MLVCGVCLKEFEKARHLRLHNARNHVDKSKWTSKCEICDKIYADEEILQRHIKNHDKVKTKTACPVEECRRHFIRKSSLDKHIALNHRDLCPNASNASKEVNNNMLKKTYCCKETSCHASFTKHHLLTQHSYIHTKIPPFQCSHCDKRFLNLVHKNRHEKVHNGYPCRHCDTVLKTWTSLLTHVAKQHKTEYKCAECNKVFYTAGRLKHHSAIHGEVREVFQCSRCERNFTRKNALKVHVKVSHLNAKEFKCPVENCIKAYAYKHSLKQHINKFHNPNPVKRVRKPGPRKTRSDKLDVASRILGINTKALAMIAKDVG